MTRTGLFAGLVALAASATACKPDLGAPQSLIAGPTFLAIRGTPAEAAEGGMVTYDALVVDPQDGTITNPQIGWAQCLIPDPPANGNDVAPGCLTIPDDAGPSPTFPAALPSDSCMLFGPETPPPMKGQPPIRPADPDTTGGFYQPVRATYEGDGGPLVAVTLERVTCRLANASAEISAAYAMDYVPNNNPQVADLILDPTGAMIPIYVTGSTGAPPVASVSAGQKVTLQSDFSPGSAEEFIYWNSTITALPLPTQRESLSLAWFATDGTFDHDVTGLTQAQAATETSTQNVWTAPTTPGAVVHFWTVLRDDRGGIDFASAEIDVTP
jgi:hypothetical protein